LTFASTADKVYHTVLRRRRLFIHFISSQFFMTTGTSLTTNTFPSIRQVWEFTGYILHFEEIPVWQASR